MKKAKWWIRFAVFVLMYQLGWVDGHYTLPTAPLIVREAQMRPPLWWNTGTPDVIVVDSATVTWAGYVRHMQSDEDDPLFKSDTCKDGKIGQHSNGVVCVPFTHMGPK